MNAYVTFRRFITENIFKISLFVKGFDGLIELLAGITLLLVHPERINRFIMGYVNDELTEEPRSKIANFVLHHGVISVQSASLIAILLIIRGVIKFLLVSGLLKRIFWVYPVAIIIFGALVIFQLYTYASNHSLFLLLLSALDLVVIILTIREMILLRRSNSEV